MSGLAAGRSVMKIYYSLSKYIKDSFLSFLLHQRCYNFLSDTIGEPADLKAEPEVVTLLQIFLNHDGDEDRIPASQQVRACVCACVVACVHACVHT